MIQFFSEIETISFDVLAGTATTLTCKIVGVKKPTTIDLQWLTSEGQTFHHEKTDRYLTVRYDCIEI